MQLIWLLPSVGFGLVLGLVSGQWLMAAFGAVTFLLLAMALLLRQNQPVIRDTDAIQWGVRSVAIGNRKLSRVSWLWKPEHRARLVSEALSQNQQRIAQLQARMRLESNLAVSGAPQGLSFFSGFSQAKELVVDLVRHGPHAFISGPTGSGKSQYLAMMLHSLTQTYRPDQLQLITIDFKGGATLGKFSAIVSTTDLDSNHCEVFAFITDLLSKRELQLNQLQVGRIEAAENMPRVVVAIDELSAVLMVRGALEVLEAVAARGRSLGVHLVATAQSTAGISRNLLVNLGLRIAAGKLDPLELAQLGFKPMPASDLGLDGMLTAKLQSATFSCDFSFPILQKTTFPKQIHLVG